MKKFKWSGPVLFLIVFAWHYTNRLAIIDYPIHLYLFPLACLGAVLFIRYRNGKPLTDYLCLNQLFVAAAFGVLVLCLVYELQGKKRVGEFGADLTVRFNVERCSVRSGKWRVYLKNDTLDHYVIFRDFEDVCKSPELYYIEAVCYNHPWGGLFVEEFIPIGK
jgi:hypothetical protein